MTYDIPRIYTVNPDTGSLIEHALKCCGTCTDNGAHYSSNGAHAVNE